MATGLNMKTLIRTRGAPNKAKSARKRKYNVTRALTEQQILFIQHYMVSFNAQKAYQASHPNASWITCRSQGSVLLHHPSVAQQIKGLLAETKKRLARDSNRVLGELAAMGFASIADVFTPDGTIIPPNLLPRDISVAVKKLKRQEILGGVDEETGRKKIIGHTVEVEMHDKLGPLKLLGQHLGMFEEQPPTDTRKDFAAILEAAHQRVLDSLRGRLIEGETVQVGDARTGT